MKLALLFAAGMFAGSTIVILFGALFAAAKNSDLNFEDEYDEINRKYIALLEHQVFGQTDTNDEEDYE